jgi:hypothetical protein
MTRLPKSSSNIPTGLFKFFKSNCVVDPASMESVEDPDLESGTESRKAKIATKKGLALNGK